VSSEAAVQGTQLLQSGDLASAIYAFEEGLRLDPKDLDCMSGLARAHLAKDSPSAAREALQRWLSEDAQSAEAQSHLALLDFRAGKKAALGRLKALADAPEAGFFQFYNLGSALQEKKDVEGARAAYEKALAAQPKSPYVLVELGRLDLDGKDPKAAAKHFEAAAKLLPQDFLPHELWARALAIGGELGRAIQVLDAALPLAPRPKEVYAELVKLCLAAGNPPAALAAGKALLRVDPADPQSLYLSGVAQLASGEVPEAARLLEQAVKKAPTVQAYQRTLAEVRQVIARAK
jgi:tetratricopeptide (TPR) repeat protein